MEEPKIGEIRMWPKDGVVPIGWERDCGWIVYKGEAMNTLQEFVNEYRDSLEEMKEVLGKMGGVDKKGNDTKTAFDVVRDWLENLPLSGSTSPKKSGSVLAWAIQDGSIEASTGRGDDGCYRIGQDVVYGKSYAYFRGKKLVVGSVQNCMQACQDKEDEKPELESGYYWLHTAGKEPDIVVVESHESIMCYRGCQCSTFYPISAIDTFEGPLKPEETK